MSNLLTPKQKRDFAAAHQMMSDMNFRVTGKQVGNGVDALLASIAGFHMTSLKFNLQNY